MGGRACGAKAKGRRREGGRSGGTATRRVEAKRRLAHDRVAGTARREGEL